MLYKKYLDKFFNFDYYKLLLKRYMGLVLIPLAIYFCLMVLIAILGGDTDALSIFLVPYAVAIVPLTSLIIFKPLTKKGDASYLFSIPLNRYQQFLTSYLVGLTIIESTLLVMTGVCFIGETISFQVRAMMVFMVLAIIYYTFACLGCMIAGQTLTQFILMGVICFGPLALYLLIKLCIANLSFGSYVSPINDSLVMMICPLISAYDCLDVGRWPYWWAHLLIVFGTFGLSLYLMNKRPLESTGNGVLFRGVEKWLVKPIIFLNIVFVIFGLCLGLKNTEMHYYDANYYFAIFALLIGISMLVSFLLSIWTSKDLRSLFKGNELIYHCCLVILASCALMLPLWQSEQEKYHSITPQDNKIIISFPHNYYHYGMEVDEKWADNLLAAIDQHRLSFTNGYLNDNSSAQILINHEMNFYLDLNQMSEDFYPYISDLMKERRENTFFEVDAIRVGEHIYHTQEISAAIEKTFENEVSEEYIQNMKNIDFESFDETLGHYDWSEALSYYYPLTLTKLDYLTWLETIKNNVTMLYSPSEWELIVNAVGNENAQKSEQCQKICNHMGEYYIPEHYHWYISQASDTSLTFNTYMEGEVMESYEDDNFVLFDGSYVTIDLTIHLEKVDGTWQAFWEVMPVGQDNDYYEKYLEETAVN